MQYAHKVCSLNVIVSIQLNVLVLVCYMDLSIGLTQNT